MLQSFVNNVLVELHDILNDTQHGFRKDRSCLSVLINVFDNILSEDKATCVDMTYLDYAKAFDKVDHEVLLYKIRDWSPR